MARKKDDRASHPDEDNPEWTAKDFERARPASEVLPKFIGQPATDELLRPGKGRPAKLNRKVNQTLPLDPDVLEAYRREGPGRQALMNEVLRQHMPRHEKCHGLWIFLSAESFAPRGTNSQAEPYQQPLALIKNFVTPLRKTF